ncbi:hypothetical protein [Kitasatospora sp. NPDC001132]
MTYAYWNQNTGQIARSDEPNVRLELLDNWHPIDPAVTDEDAPKPVSGGVFRPVELPHIPPPPDAEQEQADGGDTEGIPPPAESAPVADWRAWVIANVVDNDPAVHAEIEKTPKSDLIQKYGGSRAED